eukprot:Pgem_evm1s9119
MRNEIQDKRLRTSTICRAKYFRKFMEERYADYNNIIPITKLRRLHHVEEIEGESKDRLCNYERGGHYDSNTTNTIVTGTGSGILLVEERLSDGSVADSDDEDASPIVNTGVPFGNEIDELSVSKNVHDIGSLVKQFYRDLPRSPIPEDIINKLLKASLSLTKAASPPTATESPNRNLQPRPQLDPNWAPIRARFDPDSTPIRPRFDPDSTPIRPRFG